jgi:hypothetical protein
MGMASLVSANFLTTLVNAGICSVYFPLHPLRPPILPDPKNGAHNKLEYFLTIVGNVDLKNSIGICYEDI